MNSNRPERQATKNKIFLALLALFAVVFVLISTNRHGVVIWPDSVFYISTARSLISGGGFVSFDGEPLTLWPPLYPSILAVVSVIFKTDPIFIAATVNALIFGILVYLAGTVLYKYLSSSPLLAIEGTLAVLFSIPLFSISVVAFSELLFSLFMLISFIFLAVYLSKGSIMSLVLLSISISLSFLTRYVGVVLVLWGALIILVFSRDGLKKKIAHLSLFAIITLLPVGIWLIRNYVVAHVLLGPRTPPAFSFTQVLSLGFNNILDWFLPGVITGHLLILLFVGALIILLLGFSLKSRWQWFKGNLRQDNPTLLFSISCGSFVILYAGFVVISATSTYVSVFESRIWAPVFIPLTFLIFLFARELSHQFGKYFSGRMVNTVLVGVIAIGLVYPVISTTSNAIYLVKYGDGITTGAWMKNETIQYIREHPSECTYYSNGPDVIYILTGVDAKFVPSRGEPLVDISSLEGTWPLATRACLAWFDNINRTTLYTPNELLSITNLEQVVKFGDGVIYIVTRK